MEITIGNIIVYSAIFVTLYIITLWLFLFWENKNNIHKTKLKKNYPSVGIIVPCFNEEKTIAKTIKSLINLDYPKDKLKIVIVDDGSTDNTYQEAKKLLKYKQIKLFHKKNGGKWTALNYGLTKTNTEFIGCLDADSFVASDALKIIMSYFTNKKIMAVTPALKIYQPKNIIQRVQKIEYILSIIQRKTLSWLNSLTVTPGPFSIYRKEVFEKIGLFVSGHNAEDNEMAFRLQSKNYRIDNASNACVYTMAPASLRVLQKQRERWYQGFVKNSWDYRYIFFNKKYKDLGLFILPIILLALLTFILMMFYILFIFGEAMIKRFVTWQAIDFNFNQLTFDLDWFFINTSPITFIGFFLLIFTITIFLFGKQISTTNNNKIKNIKKYKIIFKDIKDFIFYIFLYGPLFFIWWLGTIRTLIFKKKVNWQYEKKFSKN